MSTNKVPVWEKYALSIPEAAQYFGIGENKLRSIIEQSPDANFVLRNGVKVLVKRAKFEEYVDSLSTI